MRIALSALLALAALTSMGCPDEVATNIPRPNCLVDMECAAGEACVDGFCSTPSPSGGCDGNADCDDGQVCRGVDGARRCQAPVEGGECASGADCASTERCTTEDDVAPDCLVSVECAQSEPDAGCDEACYGHCVPRDTCTGDSDCAVTEACVGDVCAPIGDCDVDDDCPATAACVAGSCTQNGACSDDEDCATDASCVDGTCTRNGACTDNGDCAADQRCADGVCLRRGDCESDDACAFDERCDLQNDGGTCVVIGECEDVDDCGGAVGVACLDGACTRAPCGRDEECDDGLFCNGQETCNPRVGCVGGSAPTTADLPGCVNEACDEENDTLVLTPVNSRCADSSPCTDDICVVDVGCTNPANSFEPAPGPVDDCVRTVCRDGALTVEDDDTEVPTNQGSSTDCLQAVCSGGEATLIPNNNEIPAQGPGNDCKRQVCSNGLSVDVADDGETPPQGPSNDCKREVCSNGAAIAINDNTEVPPQGASNDCRREVCSGGISTSIADDNEVPPQGVLTDCRREICSGGASSSVADNSQIPADVGCAEGACNAGAPTTIPNDDNCDDNAVCTVGTCNADGSCGQVADDGLCDCGGTQVGLCLPDDGRAATSGNLAGCVCLQPATLSCGTDDGVTVKQVLQRFELNASAPGAASGATFTWELVGTPAGADPSAQVIGNATSATAAFFQATSPSATGVKDYVVQVTLREPELPPQTCTVAVEAQPIPDTLEVTLFMNDGLDVDLHLIGGAGNRIFDMPFHELHDPGFGDDENRDCYWKNCPVCSVSIPGQSCLAVNTRIVDFDGDGASLADKQDPQLDIDNVRGCFTGDSGELSCVPEKITVETPAAGSYVIWSYLWGLPNTEEVGTLSSPPVTTVTIEVKCRGQRVVVPVTLRSDSADGSGVAAAADSPRRYGGDFGFVEVSVPSSGACTITP